MLLFQLLSIPSRVAEGGRGTPGGAGAGRRYGSPFPGCSWEAHIGRRGSTRRCSSASSSRTPNMLPRLSHLPEGANPGWWCCSSGSPGRRQSPGRDLLTHLDRDRRKDKTMVHCTDVYSYLSKFIVRDQSLCSMVKVKRKRWKLVMK